jgi:hypothetical protein
MAAGIEAAYRETLGEQRDSYIGSGYTYGWGEPNALDYYIDTGSGFDEAVNPDKRR